MTPRQSDEGPQTWDDFFSQYETTDPDPRTADLTCFECGARNTCPFVDDPYNTDGDCLAEK